MSKGTKQDEKILKIVVDALERLPAGSNPDMVADEIEAMKPEDLEQIRRRSIVALAEKVLRSMCSRTVRVVHRGVTVVLPFASEVGGMTVGYAHWTREHIRVIRENSSKNRIAVDLADDKKQRDLDLFDRAMESSGAMFLGEIVQVEEEKKAA